MTHPSPPTRGAGRIWIVTSRRAAELGMRDIAAGDARLGEVGARESRRLTSTLRFAAIDAIYASPLSRAVETVLPLASERGLPLSIAENLREMRLGDVTRAEKTGSLSRYVFERPPRGESLFDVYVRVTRFWRELDGDLTASRNIVVCGHLIVNQMLRGLIAGDRFPVIVSDTSYRPAHGSVFEITYVRDPSCTFHVASSGFLDDNGPQGHAANPPTPTSAGRWQDENGLGEAGPSACDGQASSEVEPARTSAARGREQGRG